MEFRFIFRSFEQGYWDECRRLMSRAAPKEKNDDEDRDRDAEQPKTAQGNLAGDQVFDGLFFHNRFLEAPGFMD
jgi:hypothetical protein